MPQPPSAKYLLLVLTLFFCRYVVIPIYLGLFLFWKLCKKTKFVKASEADLWTGKAALDAEAWPEQIPRNFLERIWFWIA
jgi:amino acid transporter